MLKRIKIRFANSKRIRKLLDETVDLKVFQKKPSVKFTSGLFIIGFSYIIGWPMVSVFGLLAVYFKEPLLFAIGSPLIYGLSHLVFIFGVFIAGKDTIAYLNTFLKWTAIKAIRRFIGPDILTQNLNRQNGDPE